MSQIIKGSTAYPPHGFQQQSAYNNVQQPSYPYGYTQPPSCNNVPQQEQQSNVLVESKIQNIVRTYIDKYLSDDVPGGIIDSIKDSIKDSILHDLKEDIRKQVSEELKSQLQELSRSRKSQKVEYSENKEDFSHTNNDMNGVRKANVSEIDKPKFEINLKMERDFKDYVDFYKKLQKTDRRQQDQRIDDFCNNWKIEKFKCTNSMEKMSNASIMPKFESDINGYFWAVLLDETGYYMVLPDIHKRYEASRHNYMGYKEAFKTGYTGGSFNFIPKAPAVFRRENNIWIIERKGELHLSPT